MGGLCSREAVKSMKHKQIDDGHIINIGSLLGHKVPPQADPFNMYCSSKYAVRALTEGTRNEIRSAGKNFRVTAISPGMILIYIYFLISHESSVTKALISLPLQQ